MLIKKATAISFVENTYNMTTEEFWDNYINEDIFEIYDIVCDFFSSELPEEFQENYDVGEVILETRSHHETAKQFDKVLQFTELIKNKQAQLYQEYFQYFDDFLIDYSLFHGETEKAENAFSNFIENPVHDFDAYLACFKKLLFYQRVNILNQAITTNYEEVENSSKLMGGSGYDLAMGKFYITLEKLYDTYKKDGIFNKDALNEMLEHYNFSFEDQALESIKEGICGPVLQKERLINALKEDRKSFVLTLQGYFLIYMYSRNFTFMLSGRLWDKLLTFWEENSGEKRRDPDSYVSVNLEKYEKYLSVLSGDMFVSNRSEMFAVLWGSVYIYDFLLSIGLIKQETYDRFINVSRVLKGKVIGQFANELWTSDFIHRWEKPDGISRTEFEEEAKIFRKSISFKDYEFEKFRVEISDELENIGELSGFIIKGGKPVENRFNTSLLEKLFDLKQGFKPEPKQDVELSADFQPAKENLERIIPVRSEAKIGRNDPCPCGSGKKYKKCCG